MQHPDVDLDFGQQEAQVQLGSRPCGLSPVLLPMWLLSLVQMVCPYFPFRIWDFRKLHPASVNREGLQT